MENDLRMAALAFGNEIYNIDDEYVLHICSTCYKPFEVYKPKRWTDATYYINAWSDDGIKWQFMDSCGRNAGSIETFSISEVVNRLRVLNRNRQYELQPSQGCCGQSSKATDYKKITKDSIAEILNLDKDNHCMSSSLEDKIQSAEKQNMERKSFESTKNIDSINRDILRS